AGRVLRLRSGRGRFRGHGERQRSRGRRSRVRPRLAHGRERATRSQLLVLGVDGTGGNRRDAGPPFNPTKSAFARNPAFRPPAPLRRRQRRAAPTGPRRPPLTTSRPWIRMRARRGARSHETTPAVPRCPPRKRATPSIHYTRPAAGCEARPAVALHGCALVQG